MSVEKKYEREIGKQRKEKEKEKMSCVLCTNIHSYLQIYLFVKMFET